MRGVFLGNFLGLSPDNRGWNFHGLVLQVRLTPASQLIASLLLGIIMVDRTFLKRHAAQMAETRALLEQHPTIFSDLLIDNEPQSGAATADPLDSQGTADGEEAQDRLGGWTFYHVTSRVHLQRRIFERDEVKQMLGDLCLHYARVCEVALVNYCFMDNHFHLEVGVRHGSATCLGVSKMAGCIKQQFTNQYKIWFNGVYRKEKRYRPSRLGNGTMWDGPVYVERIEDEAQLAACTFYIEANRLRACCAEPLGALEEAPLLEGDALQPCYEQLLETVKGYGYQSAGWYLSGCTGEARCLTSGQDGVWASQSEYEQWERVSVTKLPPGWRRVWFKARPGILKPTPTFERRYLENPIYARLGPTPEQRGRTFGRLLMGACWHGRGRAVIDDEGDGKEPGVDLS